MATSPFQVRYESPSPGVNVILLSGQITELSNLLTVRIPTLPAATSLCIDTGGVTAINSNGTRDFTHWARTIKEKNVVFSRCPKIFVDQLNMMPTMVPTFSAVTSFYVPFCTAGDDGVDVDQTHVLYKWPNNYRFENGQVVINHIENLRDQNGRLMELDVLSAKYFRFLDLFCPKSEKG